jgi:TrmH family RNA methyltransferase
VERISSRQNSVVKRFRALAHESSGHDEMLLDGSHLIDEALDSGVALEVAVFADGAVDRLAALAARAADAGVRTMAVPDALFPALSPVQHPSGAVAIARRPVTSLAAALERVPQLLLVLEGVQDPGNVGAIIRAAEACGASGVIVGRGSADPFGWKALRGAMGSSFRLPVIAQASLRDAMEALRRAGVRRVATVPRDGRAPSELDLQGPVAILLGGEGNGLAGEWVEAADERLTIPMHGAVESLNVAIAAALVLYEASKQRADVAV